MLVFYLQYDVVCNITISHIRNVYLVMVGSQWAYASEYHLFQRPFRYYRLNIPRMWFFISKIWDLSEWFVCHFRSSLVNWPSSELWLKHSLIGTLLSIKDRSRTWRHKEQRYFKISDIRNADALDVHDDVIKWKHFPRYWPFARGIHRSRWIPRTKTSDAELWCFLWSAPE